MNHAKATCLLVLVGLVLPSAAGAQLRLPTAAALAALPRSPAAARWNSSMPRSGCSVAHGFLVGAGLGATVAFVAARSSRPLFVPVMSLGWGAIGALICWTDR